MKVIKLVLSICLLLLIACDDDEQIEPCKNKCQNSAGFECDETSGDCKCLTGLYKLNNQCRTLSNNEWYGTPISDCNCTSNATIIVFRSERDSSSAEIGIFSPAGYLGSKWNKYYELPDGDSIRGTLLNWPCDPELGTGREDGDWEGPTWLEGKYNEAHDTLITRLIANDKQVYHPPGCTMMFVKNP